MQQKFPHIDSVFTQGFVTEDFFKALERELPPMVSRAEASRATGGLISAKTLSNNDALHIGPCGKIRIGSKVGYTRESFIAYLRNKLQTYTLQYALQGIALAIPCC